MGFKFSKVVTRFATTVENVIGTVSNKAAAVDAYFEKNKALKEAEAEFNSAGDSLLETLLMLDEDKLKELPEWLRADVEDFRILGDLYVEAEDAVLEDMGIKYCTNCGAKNSTKDYFCTLCGESLDKNGCGCEHCTEKSDETGEE